ncbi:hypothetical protein [Caballeronia sordidicola]|uniref:hypothetical protein n=1 Tax=Caballeronia sordidicola TaxID=196367 RepID=UPI0012FE3AE5|nr:hypothetical protein [Caballeronia sordidicola]
MSTAVVTEQVVHVSEVTLIERLRFIGVISDTEGISEKISRDLQRLVRRALAESALRIEATQI